MPTSKVNFPTHLISKKNVGVEIKVIESLLEYIIALNGVAHTIQFLLHVNKSGDYRGEIWQSSQVSINAFAGAVNQYLKAFNISNREYYKNKKLLDIKSIIDGEDTILLQTHNRIKNYRNKVFSHMENAYEFDLAVLTVNGYDVDICWDLDSRRYDGEFLSEEFLENFYQCITYVKQYCITEALSRREKVLPLLNNDDIQKKILIDFFNNNKKAH